MARKSEAEMRREAGARPAKFARRYGIGEDTDYAKRDAQWRRFDRLCAQAEGLTPAQAVALAQRLLVAVDDNGIDYGDFQSAQAVQRYVRQAIRALRGLALH